MADTYTIQIPGKGTAPQVQQLRAELFDSFRSGRVFPLARLFELFPPTENNATVAQSISERGSLEVRSGAFVNESEAVDATLTDNVGRQYGLYLPSRLALRVSAAQDLRLTADEVEVLFTIGNLPPELGFGDRFILQDLEFKVTTVFIRAAEEGNAEHRLVIQINLDQAGSALRVLRARARGQEPASLLALIASEAVGDFCCVNNGSPSPAPAKICVRAHIKVLAPLTAPTALQFDAMDQVFNQAGIRVERGTTESLVGLSHLLDLDAGACTTADTSAEQDELFQHRNNVADNELVVYFVRTLVRNDGIQLSGCASHPLKRPGCVVIVTADRWTLAHEVGHVLGLTHINDDRRLMTGNGTFKIIDPPRT